MKWDYWDRARGWRGFKPEEKRAMRRSKRRAGKTVVREQLKELECVTII